MTTLTVVPENGTVLDVLAVRYRTACEKIKAGREQWIEGTLELAAVMLEAKQRFPNTIQFSIWIGQNNLQKIVSQERAALIAMAKDPTVARTLLEQATGINWEHIWRKRQNYKPQPRRVRVRPDSPPAHPPSPRRARPARPAGRRRYKPALPDVMREDNEGIEWTRAAAQPPPPPREFGPIKALTPEQVDPDFKGTPLEFATKYGHVNLHTKEQLERNEQQELLSAWLGSVADQERTARIQVAALAKVNPDTLAGWLRKPGKREKLQGWIDPIQKSCDALRTLKSS